MCWVCLQKVTFYLHLIAPFSVFFLNLYDPFLDVEEAAAADLALSRMNADKDVGLG